MRHYMRPKSPFKKGSKAESFDYLLMVVVMIAVFWPIALAVGGFFLLDAIWEKVKKKFI